MPFDNYIRTDLPERILCSAIHIDNGAPIQLPADDITNIKTGFVVGGYRHNNCWTTLFNMFKRTIVNAWVEADVWKPTAGFITTHNRFVDRAEAYQIALKQGQLLHRAHDPDNPILISEDVW